jgi:hypothetical protein
LSIAFLLPTAKKIRPLRAADSTLDLYPESRAQDWPAP